MTPRRPKFHVKTEVRIFFSDCDPMGHCNNARFLTFLEHARVQYYKKLKMLDLRRMNAQSAFAFIVAEATITFKSPATIDEILVVAVRIDEVRNRSFLMEYEIREKKTRRLVATARTAQVMYNYRRQKPFPISPKLRRAISRLEQRRF